MKVNGEIGELKKKGEIEGKRDFKKRQKYRENLPPKSSKVEERSEKMELRKNMSDTREWIGEKVFATEIR